jgi:hypothetical protein
MTCSKIFHHYLHLNVSINMVPQHDLNIDCDRDSVSRVEIVTHFVKINER